MSKMRKLFLFQVIVRTLLIILTFISCNLYWMAVPQTIGVAMIFDWGGPNHKSHAMTSSEIFEKVIFCGAKISQNGRSEAVA